MIMDFIRKCAGEYLLSLSWRISKTTDVICQALSPPRDKGTFSVDSRERGSHARGVHPTQDTSSIHRNGRVK